MKIASIDPGREKCGFAILDSAGKILDHRILETSKLIDEILESFNRFAFDKIILGNGTSSRDAKSKIENWISEQKISVELKIVDEFKTTEMARIRYWQENPPRSWRKFLPTTMLVPPEPVDDWVAVILAERFLKLEEST